MDQLKEELVGIRIELAKMNSTLGANTESLKVHMKRTEASENRIGRVENWLMGLLISVLISTLGILFKSL